MQIEIALFECNNLSFWMVHLWMVNRKEILNVNCKHLKKVKLIFSKDKTQLLANVLIFSRVERFG